jgi:hypothetical protein
MNDFDITNIGSWEEASETKKFTWKGNGSCNEETGKDITEKEFAAFIGSSIGALRQVLSDEKIASAGLPNIIRLFIDLLFAGMNATNALVLVHMGLANDADLSYPNFETAKQFAEDRTTLFNIKDMDTWKFATENSLVWEGFQFHISPEKKFTERLFVEIMHLLFHQSLMFLYSKPDLRNSIVPALLSGIGKEENMAEIADRLTNLVDDWKNRTSQSSGQTMANTISPKINNTGNANYLTPPSKAWPVFGVILIATGIILLFSSFDGDNVSLGVLSFILMFCSIIPFAIYSSKQSKFFYKAVCADMAQWCGRSSNDLIMQWGAPTKTYKFPNDRTMTVLEYKNSIRNYASYSNKGYRYGQSKTTKYVKSFFVQDEIIINYKYTIT